MAAQASDLQLIFPEFRDLTTFPIESISFWLSQAYQNLTPGLFGTGLQPTVSGTQYAPIDFAAMLYAAHNLVLGYKNVLAAQEGALIGENDAGLASKSVGGTSVSKDTGNSSVPGAGPLNATSYGQRLAVLLRGNIAGGMYVGSWRARSMRNGALGPFGTNLVGW